MAMHSPQEKEEVQEEQQQVPVVEPLPGWELRTIPLDHIILPPDTPAFLTAAKRLALSIKDIGPLQPPGVEPDGEDLFGKPLYRPVYGRRRIRAYSLLGWAECTTMAYREPLTQEQALRVASDENFDRSDDYGATVWRLWEYCHILGVSESELPSRLMVNKNTLEKYMKLVRMPRILVECIRDGHMGQGVSQKAARLPRAQQRDLAEQVETLLVTLEAEDLEKFKVTEEMVTSLRVENKALAEVLSTPIFPDGLLESMQIEKGEQIIYAPKGLPTPAEMKHYLRGYRAVLPGEESLIDSLIVVLDHVFVAREEGENG